MMSPVLPFVEEDLSLRADGGGCEGVRDKYFFL